MAKQRIGDKKLKACSAITGKDYKKGYTHGGWEHFSVECWYNPDEKGQMRNSDQVNWKTGEWNPDVRDGKFVSPEDYERIKDGERKKAADS